MFHTSPYASRPGMPAHAYRQTHIHSQVQGSADPHRLISMLFDGLFEALSQAKGHISKREVEAKCRALARAAAIVDEGLRGSLDMDKGGKVAIDLNDLYSYVVSRITYANLKSDAAAIDECMRLMQPVKDAWNAIAPQSVAS